ncbi:Oligopeptidase A [Maioricimonas rarisocia]|uniref:oligopeptidase A n=1 Tax=Maioricimonas rarisocia TaxID=2528026 RepID=A0A517Z0A8_9PLAN|nr:M3 family metallopeptidase [Maioricimonas rarisocia]QDU35918.1 Oligopeptidase A [Maioricimonas rarisocia]
MPTDSDGHLDNPLCTEAGLPAFDRIAPEHVVPAVRQLLERAETDLSEIEQRVQPTWAGLIEPLDEIDRRFEQTWGPVGHLFGVKNSAELREAYEAVLDDVVAFGLRSGQSEPIYKALKELRESETWDTLDEGQRRIIEQRLLAAELAGIGLTGEKRERFNEIAKELSQLGTKFSNNVLDATKAYALTITDPADAEGLPLSLRRLASQSHNRHKEEDAPEATPKEGPWRITLDGPVVVPFLQHSRNRSLREEVYRAFVTRASSGDLDNSDACRRILQLRKEKAALLGYDSFAEVSLAQKMAPDVAAVEEMLETLRSASWDPAEQDMQEIHELALASGHSGPIAHWDVAFWAERLRERRFKFTDEELRPYFPHERVLQGLFDLVERLFGIRVVAADEEAPRWNDDVRFFKVLDDDGSHIASFYYDPYSRPEDKRGGAWMDTCLGRRHVNGDLQVPVAHLVCNCTPPVGDKPSLMTFREVETLFHEFGHGLQHMLTTVDYPEAAGINGVEWDAVELPSQFMENWCYHKPTLLGMTSHYETGEPLPDDLFEKIVAARTYRAGSMMLRQLTFGMTDMQLHTAFDPDGDESVFDVQKRVMEKTSVLPMLPEDRFLCSFQHIFAGGYAAGYYSYKWAEVLSADAFGAFEDAGLDNDEAVRQTGRRFRETVLAQGGSRHPMDLFKEFRGREPSPEALLRHNGLLS